MVNFNGIERQNLVESAKLLMLFGLVVSRLGNLIDSR